LLLEDKRWLLERIEQQRESESKAIEKAAKRRK